MSTVLTMVSTMGDYMYPKTLYTWRSFILFKVLWCPLLFIFPFSSSAATFDGSGTWDYSLTNNWSDYCEAAVDKDGVVEIAQKGDNAAILLEGEVFRASINGANYSYTTEYFDSGGIVTETITFTLQQVDSGVGSQQWTWSDGWVSCSGGANLAISRQQTKKPIYTMTGVWSYQTSADFSTCSGSTPSSETGVVSVLQNDKTFTYVDKMGIHTGNIDGSGYTAIVSYVDGAGITDDLIRFDLQSFDSGGGVVIWEWNNGVESCWGGGILSLTRQPSSTTYDATGLWQYTTANHLSNCQAREGTVSSGTLGITQNNISFRLNGYNGVQEGLATTNIYTSQTSFAEAEGTTLSSTRLTLSSANAGSGQTIWVWSDGWSLCYGVNDITITRTSSAGHAPEAPILQSPDNGSINMSLTPTLQTSPFISSDNDVTHATTEWQIGKRQDFSTTVFQRATSAHLTSLSIPIGILSPATSYYWRTRYYDDLQRSSPWSAVFRLTTSLVNNDNNGNGIPDNQEVDASVDMDNNGVPDINQPNIKSIKAATGTGAFGISPSASGGITSIDKVEALAPIGVARPLMPYGMIALTASTTHPGKDGELTVYLPEAAPANASWFMYNSLSGWRDYSANSRFSADRRKIIIKLKDWGHGDADGLPNGEIVDPGGLGIVSFLSGSVADYRTGSPITGAQIAINGITVTTDTTGKFLSMILPGTYKMNVEAVGYQPYVETALSITEGANSSRALRLHSTSLSFDVTGDGSVTLADALTILDILTNRGAIVTPLDTDGDGVTSMSEVIVILRYLAQ